MLVKMGVVGIHMPSEGITCIRRTQSVLGEIQDSDNLQCIPYLQRWQEMNWKVGWGQIIRV